MLSMTTKLVQDVVDSARDVEVSSGVSSGVSMA